MGGGWGGIEDFKNNIRSVILVGQNSKS
jgi:hypothetical protein